MVDCWSNQIAKLRMEVVDMKKMDKTVLYENAFVFVSGIGFCAA